MCGDRCASLVREPDATRATRGSCRRSHVWGCERADTGERPRRRPPVCLWRSALVGPNILFLLLVLCLPSMGAADLLLVFAATNTVCAAVGLSAKEVRPVAVTAAVAVRRYRRHYANGLYTVATTLYGRMDTVMLALLGETVAAGVYGTYYRIVLAGVGFASWLAPLSLRLLAASETRRTRLLWLERRMAVIALLLALDWRPSVPGWYRL